MSDWKERVYGGLTHRHRIRGTFYKKLGEASLQAADPVAQGTVLTVYVDEDGRLWARPKSEFEDGRFEELTR